MTYSLFFKLTWNSLFSLKKKKGKPSHPNFINELNDLAALTSHLMTSVRGPLMTYSTFSSFFIFRVYQERNVSTLIFISTCIHLFILSLIHSTQFKRLLCIRYHKQPTVHISSFIATNYINSFKSPHPLTWSQLSCPELVMLPGLLSIWGNIWHGIFFK